MERGGANWFAVARRKGCLYREQSKNEGESRTRKRKKGQGT